MLQLSFQLLNAVRLPFDHPQRGFERLQRGILEVYDLRGIPKKQPLHQLY